MRPVLLAQAALASGALVACTIGAFQNDATIPVLVAASHAVVAPLASAWRRRATASVAVGVPVAAVVLVNAGMWIAFAIAARTSPACHETRTACEGSGIFLAFWPIAALVLVLVASAVGGVVRLIAVRIGRGSADRSRTAA